MNATGFEIGTMSMTMFSMPGGTWGPVNLARLVTGSQAREAGPPGEPAISELMVSLRREGVGEYTLIIMTIEGVSDYTLIMVCSLSLLSFLSLCPCIRQ